MKKAGSMKGTVKVLGDIMQPVMCEHYWRPIDSALKNQFILGFGKTESEKFKGTEKVIGIIFWAGKWQVAWGQAEGVIMRPTHWMPLPEPPGDGE